MTTSVGVRQGEVNWFAGDAIKTITVKSCPSTSFTEVMPLRFIVPLGSSRSAGRTKCQIDALKDVGFIEWDQKRHMVFGGRRRACPEHLFLKIDQSNAPPIMLKVGGV